MDWVDSDRYLPVGPVFGQIAAIPSHVLEESFVDVGTTPACYTYKYSDVYFIFDIVDMTIIHAPPDPTAVESAINAVLGHRTAWARGKSLFVHLPKHMAPSSDRLASTFPRHTVARYDAPVDQVDGLLHPTTARNKYDVPFEMLVFIRRKEEPPPYYLRDPSWQTLFAGGATIECLEGDEVVACVQTTCTVLTDNSTTLLYVFPRSTVLVGLRLSTSRLRITRAGQKRAVSSVDLAHITWAAPSTGAWTSKYIVLGVPSPASDVQVAPLHVVEVSLIPRYCRLSASFPSDYKDLCQVFVDWRNAAAGVIQRQWRASVSNPACALCRSRLMYEFGQLVG